MKPKTLEQKRKPYKCRKCGETQDLRVVHYSDGRIYKRCAPCARAESNKVHRNERKWNPEIDRGRTKKYRQKVRHEVLSAYGGACSCCGINEEQFLCMDHVNGGGNIHRREINCELYAWLRRNNFPSGFQVLCHNCNMARAFYGICHGAV